MVRPTGKRIKRKRFYVYVYHKPDGTPFYVGKGTGVRYRKHLSPPRNDLSPKAMLIRELKASGTPPVIVKIAENMTERAAFELEVTTIQKIGRAPNGPLLNLNNGGGGLFYTITTEEREWLAEMRQQDSDSLRAARATRRAAIEAEEKERTARRAEREMRKEELKAKPIQRAAGQAERERQAEERRAIARQRASFRAKRKELSAIKDWFRGAPRRRSKSNAENAISL